MRAKEMNECVMNGNGTSVCRSREAERLKMKRGRIREDVRRAEGDNRGMPSILLLRESSLAPSLLSPTLFHTGSHTHRRCNAKKQSRYVYEDAFSASQFFFS